MAKIQDDNIFYSSLKPFIDHHLKKSFRRYEVIGKENHKLLGALLLGLVVFRNFLIISSRTSVQDIA